MILGVPYCKFSGPQDPILIIQAPILSPNTTWQAFGRGAIEAILGAMKCPLALKRAWWSPGLQGPGLRVEGFRVQDFTVWEAAALNSGFHKGRR